ncbi:MAG: hypothetical protein OEQ39_17490 [Gammaproteobacteria bacterium]|nr:hypothetical protein [Gammaproteobacteria bacterium]
MKKSVFVRLGSQPVPRVQRGMKVAGEMGYDTIFCGAFRKVGLKKKEVWAGFPLIRVGRVFPLLNGRRPFLYLYSVIFFQFAFLRFLMAHRPQLIHASDAETMPASIVYSKIAGVKLIYNIHDNLAQRYNVPRFISVILNAIEGLMVLLSDASLVPEVFRRDALPKRCRGKVQVVRNTPEDLRYSAPTFDDKGTIRIFYGGWLDWGRGFREMVALTEALPEVNLRVAGEGSEEIIQFIKDHPQITYLGFLEHSQSLEETKLCHFVPAFYKPVITINRYAASNKLAEALAIGRPLLINEEVEIVSLFGDSPAAIVKKFGDIEGTAEVVRTLFSDHGKYVQACLKARELYEKYYRWEIAHETMRRVFGD